MNPDTPDSAAETVDLSTVVGELDAELRCLFGRKIQFAIAQLPADGAATVSARHQDIVDLLRHLALDVHDAMPGGGTVTMRTGRLRDVADCAAIVIHEAPGETVAVENSAGARIHKGRRLGLDATYDIIKRVGGHFHVSCRGRDTVLTICFPLAG